MKNGNDIEVLKALHRFGWLRAKQLTAYLWPNATGKTNRAIIQLRKRNEIEEVRNGNGYVIGLSAKGAKRLQDLDIPAESAHSVLKKLGNAEHREISNTVIIEYGQDLENETFSEVEIMRGAAPIIEVMQKNPDGLVIAPEGLIWIEVENSYKNSREFMSMLSWFEWLTKDCILSEGNLPYLCSDTDMYFFRLVFVCRERAKFERRIKETVGRRLDADRMLALVDTFCEFRDLPTV